MNRFLHSVVPGVICLTACAGPAHHGVAFAGADELAGWEFTDASAFRWVRDDATGKGCLELHAASSYRPPHRSPLAMAILREAEFGDFRLTVKARQTGREYAHRDLVFVFAYRDPAHFAYAHLASRADDNAHQVMLVDDAPRRPVTVERTAGVAWGDEWHEIEIVRAGESVEVWFDGESVMRATVPAWSGRIGLGSFDDTGRFSDL